MTTFLAGFSLSFSLILAIGAQNAFVLRAGLRRHHVLAVVLICALSDALLIASGILGFGALAGAFPWFEDTMRWGGAAFLFAYGARSMLAAWRGGQALEAAGGAPPPLMVSLGTILALTWLNPHVYLDTLVLIGAVSAQYSDRLAFGAGAIAASFVFFLALGYGARLLAPVFAAPRAWRILDLCIGLVMWTLGAVLLL